MARKLSANSVVFAIALKRLLMQAFFFIILFDGLYTIRLIRSV